MRGTFGIRLDKFNMKLITDGLSFKDFSKILQ